MTGPATRTEPGRLLPFPASRDLSWTGAGARWLVVAAVVAGVGVAPGAERSLVWTGVASTFWQPVQTFAASWTSWWPRTLRRLAVLTVGIGCGAFLLLILGELLVARIALRGLPRFFPVLIAPAALLFETYLQLTMVFERKPFDRFGWRGGLLALLASAVVAAVGYQTLVNWTALPPTQLPPGFRNPRGPLSGTAVATWLITVAAWQVIIMVTLNGWPGTTLGGAARRITANNLAVLGGATATLFVVEATGISPALLAGAMGCIVAGGRLPYVLYTASTDNRGHVGQRVLETIAWSALVFVVLRSITATSVFRVQPFGLWIAVTGLNLVSGGTTYAAFFAGAVEKRATYGSERKVRR